jgi:hypothetical protein
MLSYTKRVVGFLIASHTVTGRALMKPRAKKLNEERKSFEMFFSVDYHCKAVGGS